MRSTMKKLMMMVVAFFMGGIMMVGLTQPVMAKCPDGYIPSAILGDNAIQVDGERCIPRDNGDGSSIKNVLKLVVRIMTVGIGIIGAIGITVAGIQYITAGGNEEQTRKAKRRIFEIVIGFFAYVLIYAALSFLIPDFNPFV